MAEECGEEEPFKNVVFLESILEWPRVEQAGKMILVLKKEMPPK